MTAPVKMKRLNVDIPEALHRCLKVEAAAQGMSLQRLVTTLLDGTRSPGRLDQRTHSHPASHDRTVVHDAGVTPLVPRQSSIDG
jgi:HicB family